MKKIKILGIQTHYKIKIDPKTEKEIFFTGGVDYARTILPLKYLDPKKFEVKVVVEPKDIDKLTKHYDILYSSYIDTDILYVKLKVNTINNNCEWIMDLDDNIWNVHKSHPFYKDYRKESPILTKQTAILKDSTYLTTTTNKLRYQMMESLGKNIKSIGVLPNHIDLTAYDYKNIPKREGKGIQIGYIGGNSHFDDVNKPEFVNALIQIMNKYDNVTFATTFFMPTLKAKLGKRYKYVLGRYNVYRFIDEVWTGMAAESDIFVAPLSDTKYSRCKSYIKYLEYSASKKPCILEDIAPYTEMADDSRVLMASTTSDWVKHLTALIEDKKLRKKLGEASYKYVKENHTIQANAKKIGEYFEEVLTNREETGNLG